MFKSIFIAVYILLAMVTTIASVIGLIFSGDWHGYLGVFLTSGPVSIMLTRLMILKDKARTGASLLPLLFLAVVGLGLSFYGWQFEQTHLALLCLGVVMAGLLVGYIFGYSKLDRSGSKLVVGDTMPGFELKDVDGASITSASFTGSPAILIFYRGNWCPLCVAQVKEMVENYDQLKKMGARVVFVSPQSQEHTISLATQFGVSGVEFMQDAHNKAAEALGIESKFGTPVGMKSMGYDSDTVLPTVVITDDNGLVVWTHETDNYRVRPEPETYLAVLKEMGLKPA